MSHESPQPPSGSNVDPAQLRAQLVEACGPIIDRIRAEGASVVVERSPVTEGAEPVVETDWKVAGMALDDVLVRKPNPDRPGHYIGKTIPIDTFVGWQTTFLDGLNKKHTRHTREAGAHSIDVNELKNAARALGLGESFFELAEAPVRAKYGF